MKHQEERDIWSELQQKYNGMREETTPSASQLFLHIPSEFALRTLIYTSYIGRFFYDQAQTVHRSRMEYYMFAFLESGSLTLDYGTQRFVVQAGDLIFLDSRRPYSYSVTENTAYRYIYFCGGGSEDYHTLLTENEGILVCPMQSVEIQSAMVSIFSMLDERMYNEHRISAQLYRILSELAAEREQREHIQNAAVLHAINYMEQHLSEPLTIEQIADQVNLSEYYFSRLFRRCTEISPHAYLVNLRITLARRLLAESVQSVEYIAEECGFHSTTNFIRSFREHVGCTPRQYRRDRLTRK